MVLSFTFAKPTADFVFAEFVFVADAGKVTSGPKRNFVLGDPCQQSGQQDCGDPLGCAGQQGRSHVVQLALGVREAQAQRIAAVRRRGLDHQPACQQIQQHVAGHFVGDPHVTTTCNRSEH